MRGLERIIVMRRGGHQPAYVSLGATPPLPSLLDDVQYQPGDVPELTDLRALVGLFVVVQGTDAELVRRWAAAAMKAEARTVLSRVYVSPHDERDARWTDHRIMGVDQ